MTAAFGFGGVSRAETAQSLEQKLTSQNQAAEALRQQVQQTSEQAASLSQEIANMNGTIDALNTQIQDTNAKIATLNPQIAALERDLAAKKALLAAHIRSDYSLSDQTTLEILAGSDNLSDFVDRKQYLERSEAQVDELVRAVVEAKAVLDKQKQALVDLQSALAGKQADVAAQIAIKNNLLAETQGQQAKYEALLAQSEAAATELANKLSSLTGSLPSRGHVTAGQIIGNEGTSGNSTGPHLHFSVYVNRAPANPQGYINSGRMRWPLDDYYISQGYGCTSYPFEPYNGSCPEKHFHDGIDMVNYFGTPVHAAASGEIIINDYQPRGFGHYIVIDHGGGLWSLYGHLQ